MDLAKESVVIKEQPAFKFRLECDDLAGYIRLTKYKVTKTKRTRITRRNIPINELAKDTFFYGRTGWFDRKAGDPFTGSYVSKEKDRVKYDYWNSYMRKLYSDYKKNYQILEENHETNNSL